MFTCSSLKGRFLFELLRIYSCPGTTWTPSLAAWRGPTLFRARSQSSHQSPKRLCPQAYWERLCSTLCPLRHLWKERDIIIVKLNGFTKSEHKIFANENFDYFLIWLSIKMNWDAFFHLSSLIIEIFWIFPFYYLFLAQLQVNVAVMWRHVITTY